jgi:hypothetical protein
VPTHTAGPTSPRCNSAFRGLRSRFFPHNATTKSVPKCLWRHAAKRGLRGGRLLQLRSLVLTHQGNDKPPINAFLSSRFHISLEEGQQLAGSVALTRNPIHRVPLQLIHSFAICHFCPCCTIKCTGLVRAYLHPPSFPVQHAFSPVGICSFQAVCAAHSPDVDNNISGTVPGPCFATQLQSVP